MGGEDRPDGDERAERVARIFDEGVELPPHERAALLDQACPGDDALRREVESLLRAHNDASAFLETPAAVAAGDLSESVDLAQMVSRQIGSYRIIDVLGTGGMSVVYLAEQDQPKRTVALKVLRPGMATPSMLRRFEHESQMLARLQHPGIAQVYEAGTADTGAGPQPFFAMELIEGLPLNEYAQARNLGTRQRLALFAKVCDAVQHAHQKGIIHRDLKPANILVDESGQPKVLDFGVARATDSDIQATTLQTDIGQLIGTIPYMSPEQVAGDPVALDTRSDVYALGVVCYELLAGRLPYDLRQKMILEAVRVICEDDPTPLSSVNRVFRGDMETIIAKALEKNADRRYQSASDLGADIHRYLKDEPITARPPSPIYQIRKFSKRNKALVVGSAAVFLALLAGTTGTTWQAVRATSSESLAQQRREEAETVVEFVADMLKPASARYKDSAVTVREVLDNASPLIDSGLSYHPAIRARLHEVTGNAYLALGLFSQAGKHLNAAYGIRLSEFGEGHRDTLRSILLLSALDQQLGYYPQVAAQRERIVETSSAVLGSADPFTIEASCELAAAYLEVSELDRAVSIAGSTLELSRRTLGDEDPITIRCLETLAMVRCYQRDLPGGQKLFEEAVQLRRQSVGPAHPDTLKAMNGLAITLSGQGRWDEAERLHRSISEIKEAELGPSHPSTLDSLYNLALLLKHRARYQESETLFVDAIDRGRSSSLPDDHWRFGPLLSMYGSVLIHLNRLEEAEQLLLEALGIMNAAMGPDDDETIQCKEWIVDLYETWGKPDKAAAWRAKLRAASDIESTNQPASRDGDGKVAKP